ncbi:hypothetical protein EAG_13978 [Camponotus floridanus]|uniref:Uncharacterized protein n=1 Tax=Camponotus floridanus TaxID=104421 RepID=E2A3G2_CAMFO|nr:uncharacterized protein LOC105248013 isoform X3 [Camponotus floridanus]EFN72026.1 hypothetical protein EAG_13978 [Camponotus floridanus]
MTGKRIGAEGDPTTIIVHADVYTQEAPSTSEHEFSVIMSSGEPSPPAQTSISTTSFDVLDNARLVNSAPITSQPAKPSGDNTEDTEAIEEAVPIVQTTLPAPQSKPEIEKNGLDTKTSPDESDVSCLINCIYYTQQCCDCTIV